MEHFRRATTITTILLTSTCATSTEQQPTIITHATTPIITPIEEQPTPVTLPQYLHNIGVRIPDYNFTQQDILTTSRNARWNKEKAIIQANRPQNNFWKHVFRTPDGNILYGDANTGALLVTFPNNTNWTESGDWHEPGLAHTIEDVRLPRGLTAKRKAVEQALETSLEDVIHNASRGNFLLNNLDTYGRYADVFTNIYESFNLPGELAAHIIPESGFNPTIKSFAKAYGITQWLESSYAWMDRRAPYRMEKQDMFTMAAHTAAYIHLLSVKYGSYAAALSAYHSGEGNVDQLFINAKELPRLEAVDGATAYLAAADFLKTLREENRTKYRRLFGTFGPESYNYVNIIAGNIENLAWITETIPQDSVYRHRITERINKRALAEQTGLSTEELQRTNPNLFNALLPGSWAHLPRRNPVVGEDETFWYEPIPDALVDVIIDLESIDVPVQDWDARMIPLMKDFQTRFRETHTPQGEIYGTIIDFFLHTSLEGYRPRRIAQYANSTWRQQLTQLGLEEHWTGR